MRKKHILITTLSVVAAFAALTCWQFQAKAAEAKYSMEDIMKKGMKGDHSLLKKVESGSASDADKKLLLAYFQAMAQFKPEKGDMASWKAKTGKLVAIGQKIAAGDASAAGMLKQAANCKECHKVHKGDK